MEFQNILPLANSFAKETMLGADWQPAGPEWRELRHFRVMLVSIIKYTQYIWETKQYFKFTAANRMSVKNLWSVIFGLKVDKAGYF